jgi:hypothetical protein
MTVNLVSDSEVTQAINVIQSIAIGIANLILSHPGPSDDQASLVEGYGNMLSHKLQDVSRGDFTVVLYKSSLDVELVSQRGGYIGFVQLGPAGYNIYFVANGYLQNKGARGYENWCVIGNLGEGDDNIITFT